MPVNSVISASEPRPRPLSDDGRQQREGKEQLGLGGTPCLPLPTPVGPQFPQLYCWENPNLSEWLRDVIAADIKCQALFSALHVY